MAARLSKWYCAAGRQLASEDNAAASQSAPSDGGWGSQGNEDDYATKGDVQAAHDSLSGQIQGGQGGMLNAGGAEDRNAAFGQGQNGGGQVQNQPPNLMADMANQRNTMLAHAADSHAAMTNTMDRTFGKHAQRAAQTAQMVAPTTSTGMQARGQVQSTGDVTSTGSGIGMSSGQSEGTMAGLMKPQNGISDNNWANAKWRQQ